MSDLVEYELNDSIATITMDDGKVNALSLQMLADINAALDRAAVDKAVVVLQGRDGMFSAGFDLRVLGGGGGDGLTMLREGFTLAERLLSSPMPVVIGCTGHAIAMGAFLLLSGDYRIGVSGPYKIQANEVAIGLTLPQSAIEICRQRLTPSHFSRTIGLAEAYVVDETAVEAGFLDRVVGWGELGDAVQAVATGLTSLNMTAHAASKLKARAASLAALRAAIESEFPD
jgi:enoyl-CoA hydratase